MEELHIHQKTFVKCLPAETLESAVEAIALKMNRELIDKNPLFISVLNGAFMFTSDLMKLLKFNCHLTFVKVSSYEGSSSTGKVQTCIGLTENIKDRTVIILEDIVDSGTTLFHFVNDLKKQNPREIKIAAMFFKPNCCKYEIKIDYLGMEIPDNFVVGYGLDYNGLGRNYRDLYRLKE